ncbi:MAG: hypothetical protein LBU53_07235 [Zoogloeaceae bacterium]|nr:hypothetical protein [Zoogloeaceae bacterium]
MTPEELKDLQANRRFPASAKELIDLIGLEATAALITAYPSQEVLIPVRPGGASLPGKHSWAQLVGMVGEDTAVLLCRDYGGQKLYVPSCAPAKEAKAHDILQKKIVADFDRLTMTEGYTAGKAAQKLGIAYGLSGRSIENFVNRFNHID